MANITRSLADVVNILEVFTARSSHITLDLEETISLADVFSEIHTLRIIKTLLDSVGLTDVFTPIINFSQVKNLADVLTLSDIINTEKRPTRILNLIDNLVLSDIFTSEQSDRYIKVINEVLTLIDTLVSTHTEHFNANRTDNVGVSDELGIQYGIKVALPASGGGIGLIDGASLTSFQAGAVGNLTIDLEPSHIFYKWDFSKAGIDNIYSPSTTIIVPIGGGLITPILIDTDDLVVDFKTAVLITDPSIYTLIKSLDGDSIITTEETKLAGDAVTSAKEDIVIEQGATFARILTYKDSSGNPVDLTGYTAKMQIREHFDSSDVLVTADTSTGEITLGGVNGTITIILLANVTDILDFVWGYYDLELYPAGISIAAIRLLQGVVKLSKQVTQ
ncbi:hypothetical protein LCGC14_0600690 [marine sediment metagenome]|uniref:Uncharacterized protein n=1 Tax=marine sediment metagenome TaxID=412755 RepID=A0A0F9UJ07_9ZZZZ